MASKGDDLPPVPAPCPVVGPGCGVPVLFVGPVFIVGGIGGVLGLIVGRMGGVGRIGGLPVFIAGRIGGMPVPVGSCRGP